MMRRAGVVLLVVGILAILASGVLSIRTLLELRTPHLAATAAAQNSAKLQMTNLKLGPGLRAQAVLELSPSPTDTPPAALDFRLLDAAGQVVLADRVVVESSATNPIVIALRKWQPAAADPVSVDIQLLDLSGQPATVNGLTLRVFDRLKDYTVALILVTYVGICGVIAATAGGVRLLARAPRTRLQPSTPTQIRRAAMLCHLSALGGYVVPFANLAGPLVMWVAGRDLDPIVERAGREGE